MRRTSWLIALAIAGCYSPKPPSGAYRCSTADNACPSGQHCVCNLCVDHDQDAACKFSVDVAQTKSVSEHQSFPVTITAQHADGTAASGFNNTVTLSFGLPDGTRWCDVTPSTVTLKNGSAQTVVTLNRETIPPQQPKLHANFFGNSGDSAGIEVLAPPFTKDADAIVAPVSAAKPFGWADSLVAEPAILLDGTGFRMYFVGFHLAAGVGVSIGVATSTDGKTFTPKMDPVFTPAAGSWYSGSVEGPAPFFSAQGVSLAFTGTQAGLDLTPPAEIGVASNADGLGTFTVGNSGNPVLKRKIMGMQEADCDYCTDSINFPQVIDAPTQLGLDGGSSGKLMFFSANSSKNIAAIGRASSPDGITWTAEPAPVLSGDIGGEAILLSPHVMIDGTIFKMWYSFANLSDVIGTNGSMCDTPIQVGYATSSDGFYWVRSPRNPKMPAVTVSGTGWDAGIVAFIAGSAVPLDGKDASSGVALYYTTLRHAIPGDMTSGCVPNGIGRSTRM
jgi:hypothetical protein